MAIYPEAAKILRERCRAYRDGVLSLDDLKSSVWDAAQTIVAVQERTFRDFLQQAEGRLDLIEHTTDSSEIFNQALQVIDELETRVDDYLAPENQG